MKRFANVVYWTLLGVVILLVVFGVAGALVMMMVIAYACVIEREWFGLVYIMALPIGMSIGAGIIWAEKRSNEP